MAVYARGKSFQAKFRVNGKDYREHFRTAEQAHAWEFSVREALTLGKPVPEPTNTVSDAVEDDDTLKAILKVADRKHWRGNPSCKSGEYLFRNAELFVEWVGPNVSPKEAFTEEKLADYVDYRRDILKNTGSTINRHMSAVRVLMKTAHKRKKIQDLCEIAVHPEGQARLRIYSLDEELMIVTVTRQWGRDLEADLFSFLADTGLRLGEAEKLPWSAWDADRNVIVLEGDITKNSLQRVVGLTPRATAILTRLKGLFGATHKGPFAWHNRESTRHLWKRLRGHFTWMDDQCVIHTFRHTCASRLISKGASLYAVQRWLGHKSPLMTQRYAKFAPKDMIHLASLLSGDERVTM